MLGKLLYESNILHITSYFYQQVIYYSYILLHQKSNFIILLYYFITFKSNNLVTSYLKFTNEHVCRTLFLLRKQGFTYEEYTKSNITSESNIIKLHITCEKVT